MAGGIGFRAEHLHGHMEHHHVNVFDLLHVVHGDVQRHLRQAFQLTAAEAGQSENRDDEATGNTQLREVLALHLDDWERPPDQRGVQGMINRTRKKMEILKDSLPVPGKRKKT